MKLTAYATQNLAPIVTGDAAGPVRSGPQLVKLFNLFGSRDIYSNGLPVNPASGSGHRFSRTQYAESKLASLSDSVNLRLLLEKVVAESESKEFVTAEVNKLISPEGYSVVNANGIYQIQGGIVDRSVPVVNEAHFQEIERGILAALDNAQVSIWVVMAWFTNETLFNKLLQKKAEGVDVKLAIYDDGINRTHGVDFAQLNHVPLRRALRGGIMHDKFCVVDNQVVITGSYNWSSNAEFRNDENIIVLKDPSQASKYSQEFKRLTATATTA